MYFWYSSFCRYTYSTTSRIPSKLDEVKKIVIVKFNQPILKPNKYVAAPTESRFWRELKTTADKTPGVKKIHVCLFLYFIRIDSFYSLYQHIIVNLQLEIRDRTGRVVFRWERCLWFWGSFSLLSFCRKALNIIISTSVYKPTYFYVGYINESGMIIISSYDLEFHKMQDLGDNQRWCLASWPKNKRARWAQVWSQGGSFWQEGRMGIECCWGTLSSSPLSFSA